MSLLRSIVHISLLATFAVAALVVACTERPTSTPSTPGTSIRSQVQEFEALSRKAEAGNADAQVYLGLSYFTGVDAPQDLIKAERWLHKAATQNHIEAQYFLGTMYINEKGALGDRADGVGWIHKAASQGQTNAQLALGVMHFKGDRVPKDNVLAYAWLNLAASNGTLESLKYRSQLESRLTSDEINEAKQLSSNWRSGRVLVRNSTTVSTATSSSHPLVLLVAFLVGLSTLTVHAKLLYPLRRFASAALMIWGLLLIPDHSTVIYGLGCVAITIVLRRWFFYTKGFG